MMVDILCALLAGGPISKDIPGMSSAPLNVKRGVTHFFTVIDIAKFVDVDLSRDACRTWPTAFAPYRRRRTLTTP